MGNLGMNLEDFAVMRYTQQSILPYLIICIQVPLKHSNKILTVKYLY